MKQQVQLYIGGEQADLFKDESISVTSTIQNVKDIAKVFTDYSQSFTIPASKTNNKIFKHYYNSDIINGFDAQTKVDATLEINYLPFREGKLRLDEVQLKSNKPYAYKVTFFGNLVNLKDLFGEDELDGLDWLSNFDTEYSYTKVRDLMSSGADFTIDSVTYTDAIITPLISAQDRWYYDSTSAPADDVPNLYNDTLSSNKSGINYFDLKYAIRLYPIIKAIEEKYNTSNGFPTDIVFSDDFFIPANSSFYNLYMWLHREKGRFVEGQLSEYLNKMPKETLNGMYVNPDYFTIYDIFSWFGAAESYQVDLNIVVSSTNEFTIDIIHDYTGVVYTETVSGSTSYTISSPDLTQNGTYRIKITSDTAQTIYGNLTTAETYLDVTRTASVSGTTDTTNMEFTADQTMASSLQFNILDQIPKIKVIDFLTGLFKMFNLTAYYNNGTIVVDTLNTYYASGTNYDITEYVDVSQTSVKPVTLHKDISFTYKGLGSYLVKKHLELFNLNWGEEKYNIENKYEGNSYKVEVPFEHYKYERLVDNNTGSRTDAQWGWAVDDFNVDDAGNYVPSTYVGMPLVFYAIRKTSATPIRVHSSATYNSRSIYYIPSNSLSTSASQTINFNQELNEYSPSTEFTFTLFNSYYSDYISAVFDAQNRLTSITAYLPLRILLNYNLGDRFIINGKSYKINSVSTDLATGKSQIELLNDI